MIVCVWVSGCLYMCTGVGVRVSCVFEFLCCVCGVFVCVGCVYECVCGWGVCVVCGGCVW